MLSICDEIMTNVIGDSRHAVYDPLLLVRFPIDVLIHQRDAYGVSVRHKNCGLTVRVKKNGVILSNPCDCPVADDDFYILLMWNFEKALSFMSNEEKTKLKLIIHEELLAMKEKETDVKGTISYGYYGKVCAGLGAVGGVAGAASFFVSMMQGHRDKIINENQSNRSDSTEGLRAIVWPSMNQERSLNRLIYQRVQGQNGQSIEQMFEDNERNREDLLLRPREYLVKPQQPPQQPPQ